jgi:hypothetical protein
LEHVPDPLELIRQCHRLLAPHGQLALVTHNYGAVLNRLLGKRSPIIDIEHLQLFNPESIRYLLNSQGFSNIEVLSISNRYRIGYWLRLLPLPVDFKRQILRLSEKMRFSEVMLSLNVGNILSIATKHPTSDKP